MDGNHSNRAEAERWLTIAEKLLTTRDLIGSKTFAIRARESDPSLEFADPILAVADTLLAGDKRINNQHDWYAILQLTHHNHSSDYVSAQFRRLALLLNPIRNRVAYAEEAFRLVSEAWTVLSNPSKKVLYDNELSIFSKLDPVFPIGPSRVRPIPEPQPPQPHYRQHHQQQNATQNPKFKSNIAVERNLADDLGTPQPTQPPYKQIPQQNATQNPKFKSNIAVERNAPEDLVTPQPPYKQHQQQNVTQSPKFMSNIAVEKNATEDLGTPQPPYKQQNATQNPKFKSNIAVEKNAAEDSGTPQPPQPQHQQQNATQNPNFKSNIAVEDSGTQDTDDGKSTFWTACPYCYNIYEYPKVYVDCALRCQNCIRAFHASVVPVPPITEGNEYFCCWGFFPLGISASNSEKNKGGASSWTPFSPIFACPSQAVEHQDNTPVPKPKRKYVPRRSGPVVYIDDDDDEDDVLDQFPEESDSDDEWGSRKRKKAKNVKAKSLSGKRIGRPPKATRKDVAVSGGSNLQDESVMPEETEAPIVTNTLVKKAVASQSRKQTRSVAKELGKLDLNVEFSNEVEEPVPGRSEGNAAGNGEEDGIEGTGFFEGLDEFLNSLPILKANQ